MTAILRCRGFELKIPSKLFAVFGDITPVFYGEAVLGQAVWTGLFTQEYESNAACELGCMLSSYYCVNNPVYTGAPPKVLYLLYLYVIYLISLLFVDQFL
jgi:hypothetical protein